MDEQKVQLDIIDMSCANCATTIEERLSESHGVLDVQVNYATDEATIQYDPGETSLSEIYSVIESAGYSAQSSTSTIEISDMTCANCAKTNEESLESVSGVITADVNYATDEAQVNYNPEETGLSRLYEAIEEAGYSPVRSEESETVENTEIRKQKRLTLFGASLSVPFLLLMIDTVLLGGRIIPESVLGLSIEWFELLLATPVQFVLGRPFYKNSYNALINNHRANMDVLIALGSTTAYIYSVLVILNLIAGGTYFDTAALILVFITLGNYLEARSKGQAGEALQELLELEVDTATVIEDNVEKEVSVESIETGDRLKVRPGEKIPTDGVVVDGSSAVDESMITGESVSVDKTEGDSVVGSTINKNGVLIIEATKTGEDTALQQIIQTVKQAQSQQPDIQNIADRISAYFVPAVIINALFWSILWMIFPETLSAFVNSLPLWDLVTGGPAVVGGSVSVFEFSVVVFASSVLIACPCALGLATPAATMVGTTLGAQNGILFRGGDILERAEDIDTVVFDKTGTLTTGEMKVTDIVSFSEKYDENAILELAASVESGSEHPLGMAIVEEAEDRDVDVYEPKSFESVPGKGVKAEVDGHQVVVGNERLVEMSDASLDENISTIEDMEEQGNTAMIVVCDGDVVGVIATADSIKETSKRTVSELKRRNVGVMMITGDNSRTAKSVADKVGINIDNVRSEVLPEDKSQTVDSMQSDGSKVMMVGDGVNDAPALTVAHVGIAIGSGTDVAIEAADITLMSDDPFDVVKAIRISEATLTKIKQNLIWALGYNTAMIPLASLGLLQPVLAAIAMAFSSISVLLNSLLFRRYNPEDEYRILSFLRP